MKKTKQMVLQFRIDGHGSGADLDRLIDVEEKLDLALQRNGTGYVDGHDVGSGEMNLFIFVDTWERGTWFMSEYLKNQPWGKKSFGKTQT